MRPFTIPIKRRPSIALILGTRRGLRSTCGAPRAGQRIRLVTTGRSEPRVTPRRMGVPSASRSGRRNHGPCHDSSPRALHDPRLRHLLRRRVRRLVGPLPCWEIPLPAALRRLPAASGGGLLRAVFLLVLSYYFYASWNWRYLPLIFGSSTVDFFLARAIAREERPAPGAAMLGAHGRAQPRVPGLLQVLELRPRERAPPRRAPPGGHGAPADAGEALKVLLPPVGISFFTFESMSYIIDVYRGELEPHRSYLRYLLFVSFFPHLVAGPIVRPRELLPQLERPPSLTRGDGGRGALPHRGRLREEARHLRPARVEPRQPRLRAAGELLRARGPRRRLRLRGADLLRLLRATPTSRSGRRCSSAALPEELRRAVPGDQPRRLLAALAHLALDLAARLPLHPARRQPRLRPGRRTGT